MKRIFAIIFSLQLILSPVALAQGTGDSYRQGDSNENGGAGFYTSQILGLTTSLIGAGILTSCKSFQPSMLIFMGGSLVHILGEIAGGKAQNNFQNAKADNLVMVEAKMKEGGDLQKEIIETALAEEKDTRDFIKKRKNWMTAVTVIYYAAMAVAIIEFILSLPNPPAGIGMNRNAGANCSGPNTGGLLKTVLIGAYSSYASKTGGSGAISTYGGMAVGLGMMIPKVGKTVSKLYSQAIPRAITFGVSAVLATTITSGLAKRQKIAEDNISKMERVVADFKKNTTPTNGLEEDPDPKDPDSNDPTKVKQYDIKKLAEGNTKKDCLSNTPEGLNYSEGGCSNVYKINTPKFDFSLNNPSLVSANNLASDMAQALANGDMDKADIAAGGLNALAARIKDTTGALQAKLNDHLKSTGKPAIDFDKEINSQVAAMQSSLNNGSDSGSGSQIAALSKLDKAEISKTDSPQSNPSPITTATAPALPEMDMGLGGVSTEEIPMETSEPTASLDESLGQYESTVEDISKKSDVSIFKQVSNRYLLNYTKIFKEKERIDGEAAP